MSKQRVLFSSSDDDDDDKGTRNSDVELARELAAAADRERRRNPHAEIGRAKMPRARQVTAAAPPATHTKNLMSSSSSSSSDDDGSDDSPSSKSLENATVSKVEKSRSSRRTGGKGKEEEAVAGLSINKDFAAKYEERKRKQELHTLTEKYKKRHGSGRGPSGESSSDDDEEDEDDEDEDEDDEAVLLTPEKELAFAKALLAVRKAARAAAGGLLSQEKLPKQETEAERFFPPTEVQTERNTAVYAAAMELKRRRRSATENTFTMAKEYARAVKATAASEDAVVDGQEDDSTNDGLRRLKPQSSEEAQLRAAFLKDMADSADAFDVQPVVATKAEVANGRRAGVGHLLSEEEQRYLEEKQRLLEEAFAVRGSTKPAKETAEEGGGMSDNVDSGEDENEQFLRNFFVQELWRPTGEAEEDEEDEERGGSGQQSHHARLQQLAEEEQAEAFYNDAEVWEREFQEKKYRHQEASDTVDSVAQIETFPRPIGASAAGLLRRPDTSRKDARQRRRDRAEATRAQEVAELKRLKHLKRREIDDQRALIASVAGIVAGQQHHQAERSAIAAEEAEEEAELAKLKLIWSDKDLDAPFDPAEFDAKMAQLFNEEYYDEKNVNEDEIAYFAEELDKEDAYDEEGVGSTDDASAATEGKTKASLRRGKRDLDPALFSASSLDEARAMLSSESNSSAKSTKNRISFFDDLFESSPSATTTAAGAKGASDTDDTDMLSILYPTASLHQLEKKQDELNQLLAATTMVPSSSAATAAGAKAEQEALVAKLKADLKQKEEEYYRLHRDAANNSSRGSTFQYRETPAEDFTLSVEEILALDDRQLNMIAPMDCYAAYLDKGSNLRDRRRIERRRLKGLREISSDRSSRRYGNVQNTIVLDPNTTAPDVGEEIVRRLDKRLRDDEDRHNGNGVGAVTRNKESARVAFDGPGGEGGSRSHHGGRGRGNGGDGGRRADRHPRVEQSTSPYPARGGRGSHGRPSHRGRR